MAKITNRQEEAAYWAKKNREGVKKYQEKLKSKPRVYKKRPVLKSTPKKTYKIKKTSKKEGARLVKYLRLREIWFQDENNQLCKVHLNPECTREKPYLASEVHHPYSGCHRSGHYLDTTTWIPICAPCHKDLHDKNSKEKLIELGLKKISPSKNKII